MRNCGSLTIWSLRLGREKGGKSQRGEGYLNRKLLDKLAKKPDTTVDETG